MLSICIPVYNYNVVPLVKSLSDCIQDSEDIEIIVADDASSAEFLEQNEELFSIPNAHYFKRDKNSGRSAIRNFLAEKASKDYLLYLDADSAIEDCNFIQRYKAAAKEADVICGGTSYNAKPKEKDLVLRYVFGINREVRAVIERQKFPYRSFSSHNFCIKKSLFLDHPFDEQIKSYGHEDTLLGLSLKKRGISIKHIDNPLIHIGLEPALDFINKTNTGLENLISLVARRPELNEMAEEVKVLRYFFKLKKLGLIKVGSAIYRSFKGILLKNLLSEDPSLFYFDLYKLSYLCAKYDQLK